MNKQRAKRVKRAEEYLEKALWILEALKEELEEKAEKRRDAGDDSSALLEELEADAYEMDDAWEDIERVREHLFDEYVSDIL